MDKVQKHKWIFLGIGLVSSVLNVYLFIWSETEHPAFNTMMKFLSEWFMLIACLGIGKAFFDVSGKLPEYMSRRAFMFYILHYIWLVLFQYLMHDMFARQTIWLYIIPVLLAYATTLMCCEICIRIPLVCCFMGTKPLHRKQR